MKRFNETTLKKYLCNDRFNAYNDTGKNSYEKFTRATRCKKLLRLERYTFKNVTQKYICRTTLLKASEKERSNTITLQNVSFNLRNTF